MYGDFTEYLRFKTSLAEYFLCELALLKNVKTFFANSLLLLAVVDR